MAEFNLEQLIDQVVEKLTGNKNTVAQFKKDPMGTVKKILGNIDLDNEMLEKIVTAVKGKINLDELAGKAGGLKNILGKLKGIFGK